MNWLFDSPGMLHTWWKKGFYMFLNKTYSHSFLKKIWEQRKAKSDYSSREFYCFVTCKSLNRDCTVAWLCWIWFKTVICQLILLSVFFFLPIVLLFYCMKSGHNLFALRTLTPFFVLGAWKQRRWSNEGRVILYCNCFNFWSWIFSQPWNMYFLDGCFKPTPAGRA